jgi:hypothetical protein
MQMTTIRRFDVLSVGKIMGATYGLLGLIFGLIFSFLAILGATAGLAAGNGGEDAVFGFFFGAGAIIFLPIFYGFMGFVAGIVGSAIYNLVAGFAGGIQVELDSGAGEAAGGAASYGS